MASMMNALKAAFITLLYANIAAANNASPLCIQGCCGLSLPLNTPHLNLQGQPSSSSQGAAVTIPLQDAALPCCPCPASNEDSALPEMETELHIASEENATITKFFARSALTNPIHLLGSSAGICPDYCSSCTRQPNSCDYGCCYKLVHGAAALVQSQNWMEMVQLAHKMNDTTRATDPSSDNVLDTADHEVPVSGHAQVHEGKSEL